MTMLKQALLVLTATTMVMGQRGSFAGIRPIGYPDIATPTTTPAAGALGNRFGDGQSLPPTTTQRLPLEANGDRALVERLSKLPVDNQPFWFINWQALEAQRRNPQTYPQKPNDFAPLLPHTSNNFQGGSSSGNANTANTATNSVTNPPPKQSNSGNRDVDVSAFMNNKNGLMGSPVVSDNSNTAFKDNANRPATSSQVHKEANSLLSNKNADVASFPTYPTKPNPNSNEYVNTNLQAQTQGQLASMSYDQSATPQVSPIFDPEYPDIPTYPILDPKTRDPYEYSPTFDSNYARPASINRFRDSEEHRPVFVPYSYTRLVDRPLYYFK